MSCIFRGRLSSTISIYVFITSHNENELCVWFVSHNRRTPFPSNRQTSDESTARLFYGMWYVYMINSTFSPEVTLHSVLWCKLKKYSNWMAIKTWIIYFRTICSERKIYWGFRISLSTLCKQKLYIYIANEIWSQSEVTHFIQRLPIYDKFKTKPHEVLMHCISDV